jgi:nitrogen regulatory protein P-II 1
MKEVKAFIKHHMVSQVAMALVEIQGVNGLTISDMRGFGRGRGKNGPRRIVHDSLEYIPGIRIELLCRDGVVDEVVSAIEKAAHTGLKGDGKIYVIPVESAVRIRTGERDENAV